MIRRLGFYAVAAWVALTINFLIPHVLPGTPVEAMLAQHPQLTASAVKALDLQFGIGHQGSLLHQYGVYLDHLFHGNLGVSTAAYPATVTSVLRNTIPWTLALVGTATVISFILGTLLGILAGWRRGGRFDQRRPRSAHGADEFRRVQWTERGGKNARLRRWLKPRARRDIAPDASAIAVCAVAARRMGNAGRKGRSGGLSSRSGGYDDEG